ncbi:hypothetical protein ANCCAN_04887 [Ancylostoma caninum]|uniref:Uncharacterized protein n=1 Tax=Ancylostoma caninum TaxID=29170 RepID=A0A368H178_ANCCA|nr:hypothetical protein ANCCAN_04887 [Ancylostoma caninum]
MRCSSSLGSSTSSTHGPVATYTCSAYSSNFTDLSMHRHSTFDCVALLDMVAAIRLLPDGTLPRMHIVQ